MNTMTPDQMIEKQKKLYAEAKAIDNMPEVTGGTAVEHFWLSRGGQ